MIADLHRLVAMLDQINLDEIAHQLAHIRSALMVLICVLSALVCVSAIRLAITIQEWRYARLAGGSDMACYGGGTPSDDWDG